MNQSLKSRVRNSALAPEPASPRPLPDATRTSRRGARSGTAETDAGAGPAALADLVAAGLVSHEMIGDPARLGGEAAALRLLCAHVSGSIWRIEPYHYAFRLEARRRPGGGGRRARGRASPPSLAPTPPG